MRRKRPSPSPSEHEPDLWRLRPCSAFDSIRAVTGASQAGAFGGNESNRPTPSGRGGVAGGGVGYLAHVHALWWALYRPHDASDCSSQWCDGNKHLHELRNMLAEQGGLQRPTRPNSFLTTHGSHTRVGLWTRPRQPHPGGGIPGAGAEMQAVMSCISLNNVQGLRSHGRAKRPCKVA